MSQGPGEYGGAETPDPYEALLDPDDEAERGDIADALDPIDQGDPAEDEPNLYDTSWVPPDRPPGHGDFGTTLAEQREGESLDLRLSEEEPDVSDGIDEGGEAEAATEREAEDAVVDALVAEGEDIDVALDAFEPQEPRAGRLVADDEGAHPDAEKDMVARDVGISGAGASAEEAAVHIIDEEQ
jgi:hypothetical protein